MKQLQVLQAGDQPLRLCYYDSCYCGAQQIICRDCLLAVAALPAQPPPRCVACALNPISASALESTVTLLPNACLKGMQGVLQIETGC